MVSKIDFLGIAERLALLFSSYSVMNIMDEDALKNEVLGYYRTLYGYELCSNCRNTLYPEFLKMKNNYQQKILEKMAENAKKYRLKDGQSFRFFGEGTVYTNKNLTDAIAEMFLQKFPKRIDLFEINEGAEVQSEPKPQANEIVFDAPKNENEVNEGAEVVKETKKGKK